MASLEGDALRHLEHRAAGESLAVPVAFKKDGSLTARSSAVSGETFRMLGSFAREKAGQIHERIASGEADVRPYRYGGRTGCDYCTYRHICGFDSTLPGYSWRQVDKMKQEDALERIRRSVEQEGGEERS